MKYPGVLLTMSGEKLSELKQLIILYSLDTFATTIRYVRSFALGQDIFTFCNFKLYCFLGDVRTSIL